MSKAGERLIAAARELGDRMPPAGPFKVVQIGEVTRVLDRHGTDVMRLANCPERIAELLNCFQNIWFPKNHFEATEDYVKRLEKLLKEVREAATPTEHSSPSTEAA